MGFHYIFIFYLVFLFPISSSNGNTIVNESEFFTVMKKSLSGNPLGDWAGKNVCNYTGITCNHLGNVVKIDISGWSLSGRFPENICSYLPQLKSLNIGHNDIHGDFPYSITNCSLLEELTTTHTNLAGKLPDMSPMVSLRFLDMSSCSFTGKFPMSIINLTNLEVVNFNENGGFDLWRLPDDIFRLTKLRSMILSS